MTETKSGVGRAFRTIWLGQALSMLGTGLTEFGLAVWMARHTGSVTQFTLTVLFAVVPGLLVTPWAGSLVDRGNRKRIIVSADITTFACGAALAVLLMLQQLDLWHLYLLTAVMSICQAFRSLAFAAVVPSLVQKENLGQASGMIQLAFGVSRLIAPPLAGALFGFIGLSGIVLVDLLASLIAIATVVIVRFPATGVSASEQRSPVPRGFRQTLAEFLQASHYLRASPTMTVMMAYSAIGGFLVSLVMVLVTPIVLSTYSEAVLGTILSCASAGMIAGSISVAVIGTPSRLTLAIFVTNVALGLAVAVAGANTWLTSIYFSAFAIMFCSALVTSCDQTLWQRKVPSDKLGRIFAVRQMIATAAMPLAAVLGGLAADNVFEPLMMPDGGLAALLGPWIGVGKGRGVGLMFIIAGLVYTCLAVLALCIRRMRCLDLEIPDAF